MGISCTLWRLSKLSWVSYGMKWCPGLCVPWRVPAKKAPFRAAHGSCQHHPGKETCWYPLPWAPALLPAPCSSLPANAAAAPAYKGADPPRQPPLAALLHSRTHSGSSLLLLLPNMLRCLFVCFNHPIHTLSILLGPRSHVWGIP